MFFNAFAQKPLLLPGSGPDELINRPLYTLSGWRRFPGEERPRGQDSTTRGRPKTTARRTGCPPAGRRRSAPLVRAQPGPGRVLSKRAGPLRAAGCPLRRRGRLRSRGGRGPRCRWGGPGAALPHCPRAAGGRGGHWRERPAWGGRHRAAPSQEKRQDPGGENLHPRLGLLGTAENNLTVALPAQLCRSLARGVEGSPTWRDGHTSVAGESGEGEHKAQN